MTKPHVTLADHFRPGAIECLAAVLLAATYVRAAYLYGGASDALKVLLCLVIPALCVWYPDLLGGAVAIIRPAVFRIEPVPDSVVRLAGWALLILPGTVLIAIRIAGILKFL